MKYTIYYIITLVESGTPINNQTLTHSAAKNQVRFCCPVSLVNFYCQLSYKKSGFQKFLNFRVISRAYRPIMQNI